MTSSPPLDILAVSPHPDDVEIGCSGSLLLAVEQGLRISIVDLSEGERSSRGTPGQRLQEKKKATEILGIEGRYSLGFPDSEIGKSPQHRLELIQLIRKTRPHLLLAPYWKDRHPDHASSGQLVQEACFYAGVTTLGSGDPFRPKRVIYYMIHSSFSPSFVVDISSVWDQKMAAIQAYQSQFQSTFPGPQTAISQTEFLRFLETRSLWFGAMIGTTHGEAFWTQGPVALSALPMDGEHILQSEGQPHYNMFG